MNQENREKLQKELIGINEKINNLYVKSEEEKNLYTSRGEKERELGKIRKPIYLKYVKKYPMRSWKGNIKSSVKQGIKVSVGAKNLREIGEWGMISLVKRLIVEDLKGTDTEKISLEIKKINDVIDKINKKEAEEQDILRKKREEIYYQLNKERMDKEKEKERGIEEIKKAISNLSPEGFEKMKKEVNRRLIIEKLQDGK
jgi:hypothetical protein